jgi:hypothetical protein
MDQSGETDHHQSEKLGVEEEHQNRGIDERDRGRDENEHAEAPQEPNAQRVPARESRDARYGRGEYRCHAHHPRRCSRSSRTRRRQRSLTGERRPPSSFSIVSTSIAGGGVAGVGSAAT